MARRGGRGSASVKRPRRVGRSRGPRRSGTLCRKRAAWGRHGRGGWPGIMSSLGSPVRAYDFLLKFLLVGDSDVGKGEILASLQDGAAESPYGHPAGERAATAPGGAALGCRCERPLRRGSSPRSGWAGLGPACWGRLRSVGGVRKAARGGRRGRSQVRATCLGEVRGITGGVSRETAGSEAMTFWCVGLQAESSKT